MTNITNCIEKRSRKNTNRKRHGRSFWKFYRTKTFQRRNRRERALNENGGRGHADQTYRALSPRRRGRVQRKKGGGGGCRVHRRLPLLLRLLLPRPARRRRMTRRVRNRAIRARHPRHARRRAVVLSLSRPVAMLTFARLSTLTSENWRSKRKRRQ